MHKLLDNYTWIFCSKDPSTFLTLSLAIMGDRADTVRTLLSAGSPIEDRIGGLSPKMKAAFESHALNALASNDIKMFSSLLNAGLDPNTKDGTSEDNTLCHWAASFGRYEILKQLLSRGADQTSKNSIGRSALDEAERGGHDRCAALLRPSNKSITTVTPTKTTKLDSKTEEEDDDIFKTLSWTCKKVDVPAGDVFELPVSVVVPSKNLVLTWNFTSYGGDVGFGVVNQDDDTDIVLLRRTDVPSGVAISGSVDIPARCNTLLILFDNTYSWWNDKQVSYKFELRNSIMSSSSSKNRMSKKKQTSSDRIKACREVMRLTRGAIENASEAAKSLRLNREEAERHLRMLRKVTAHVICCVSLQECSGRHMENLNSRMRSLVLKHVMSYDSIRSCDLVRRYLEKEDVPRCTSARVCFSSSS